MPLTVFTQNDVNRIVKHLKLPPYQRRAIGQEADLYYRLDWVEKEDARNGTNIAAEIQGYLDSLDTLDAAINTELETGAGAVESLDKRVDDMYAQKFSYRDVSSGGTLAQLQGKQQRYDELVRDIKRELYYLAFDNRIPLDGTIYPPHLNYSHIYPHILLLDV